MLNHPTIADAILDRLVHNSYRLELDGPSLHRTKDAVSDQNIEEEQVA